MGMQRKRLATKHETPQGASRAGSLAVSLMTLSFKAVSFKAVSLTAVSLMAVSLMTPFAMPALAEPQAWPPEALAELQRKPQITRRAHGVTATFFVAASPQAAYAILTDHAHLPAFMPNLDSCRVLRKGPTWAEVEMRNARGAMVLRREFEPPRHIRWRLVKGAMLKRVDGSWSLEEVDGGTVLTYDSEVEPAVPVPKFLVQAVQQDSLEALVANVRQRIDSHGTWIKPGHTKGRTP